MDYGAFTWILCFSCNLQENLQDRYIRILGGGTYENLNMSFPHSGYNTNEEYCPFISYQLIQIKFTRGRRQRKENKGEEIVLLGLVLFSPQVVPGITYVRQNISHSERSQKFRATNLRDCSDRDIFFISGANSWICRKKICRLS